MTAICKKCKHLRNKEPNSVRRDVWYNHLCLASPLPTELDPYDGEIKPYAINSAGDTDYPDEGFHFCRDINPDGSCTKFCAIEMSYTVTANDKLGFGVSRPFDKRELAEFFAQGLASKSLYETVRLWDGKGRLLEEYRSATLAATSDKA